MVLLEAIGLAGTEVFNYNKEIFEYDSEQRLKRDVQSVDMQIARFELFREDIEDLVKLTVDKMDMYHLVGALFLSFTITMFTEGRLHEATIPSFFLGIHFLAAAGALVFLLLAVWLSMHASICSHSFGVRLRCRYVRLPIPSLSQLSGLAAKLADFERTGVANVMRIPFSGVRGSGVGGGCATSSSSMGRLSESPTARDFSRSQGGGPVQAELLGTGQPGFADEDLMDSARKTPGTHVQLFRELQAKWQCYDAYARVCMCFGVNQMTLSISYFLIGSCLIVRNSVSTVIVLVFVFQVASASIIVLDISGLQRRQIFCLHVVGALPPIIVLVSFICAARDDSQVLALLNKYPLVAAASFIQALYFEILLWICKPVNDDASLPRRFRTVLFLDVFGDKASDPTDAEHDGASRSTPHDEHAAVAEGALVVAWMGVRRWDAIPKTLLTIEELEVLSGLLGELTLHRQMLKTCLCKHNAAHRRPPDSTVDDMVQFRSWQDLSTAERINDHYYGFYVGPLRTGHVYDLDKGKMIDQKEGQSILTLEDVATLVATAVAAVRIVVRKEERTVERKKAFRGREGNKIDAQKFNQPDRLPWKTVRRMTRILQFSWVLLGTLHFLQEIGLFSIDHNVVEAVEEDRRLRQMIPDCDLPNPEPSFDEIPPLVMEAADIDWIYGSYFQLSFIARIPNPRGLLVGGRNLHYFLDVPICDIASGNYSGALGSSQSRSGKLNPALPRDMFPAGAVPICGEDDIEAQGNREIQCMWGAIEADGLAIWPLGTRRSANSSVQLLPFAEGMRPWRRFAGAIRRCLATMDVYCLVLVGWDGESLPIATVALPLAPGAVVVATMDAPLPLAHQSFQDPRCVTCQGTKATSSAHRMPLTLDGGCDALNCRSDATESVSALHVDARSGRLWVALGGAEILVWDLSHLSSHGRWRPRRVRSQSFSSSLPGPIVGVSEDAGCQVFIVAVAAASIGAVDDGLGAELLWTKTPVAPKR